jgi:hypothetical protein
MSEQQPDDGTPEPTDTEDTEDTSTDSEASNESKQDVASGEQGEITDEQLPEDLQPTEDNPLARHPGQTGDEDDKIGAGTEGSAAENPSASMGYGSDDSDD